ncbi:tRNA 4-demethylwyosine synthase (AdoMet-dependent) [Sarracenia purpurea var. burkii]
MAVSRLGRQAKRSYGFCIKTTAVGVLGLCFVLIWSMFSSSSMTSQRSTFGEFAEPLSTNGKLIDSEIHSPKKEPKQDSVSKEEKKSKFESDLAEKNKKKVNGSASSGKEAGTKKKEGDNPELTQKDDEKNRDSVGSDSKGLGKEEGEQEEVEVSDEEEEEEVDGEGKGNDNELDGDVELIGTDQEAMEKVEDESGGRKRKTNGPLFDPKAHYTWKLCNTRSKHNYIPCIDVESGGGRRQSYRHHERSCPRTPPMCLVPLPHEGYGTPISWPESKLKILYKNVAHPKLAAFVKIQSWVVESGEYLTFPQNQTEFKGGLMHYLESIEEMVPDIVWGKNIRIVLDIGCTDSSFAATLLDRGVLVLTIGLNDDLVDLAQVALERGFPAVISPLGNRRLPFPSSTFDAIHCGECHIHWHSNGGKLLLEMNRILRSGGYFILSTKHDSIEVEEGLATLCVENSNK